MSDNVKQIVESERESIKIGDYKGSWGQYYPTKKLPTRCTFCGKKAVKTRGMFMGGICYGVCKEHLHCECCFSHGGGGVAHQASIEGINWGTKEKNLES